MTPRPNSSFSEKLPSLQIFIDASSLSEFKVCPRRYYYSIVMQRQPSAESIHLTFGILLHKGAEMYHKARANKLSHDEAVNSCVAWAMEATWDREHNRPWTSGDKYKNRFTLIRTLVWYLDKYERDALVTVILDDGKPAVEVPFVVDSGHVAVTGEDISLCGTLDRIVTWNDRYYVSDIKTTKSTIAQYYFDRYSPDNQVSTYRFAGGAILREDKPIEGLIIDACQVAIEFSAFDRGFIERSDEQMREWQRDLGYWTMQMGVCAESQNWPKNDSACNMYGGCPYRPVCSQKNTENAERILSSSYRERVWDPLRNRSAF